MPPQFIVTVTFQNMFTRLFCSQRTPLHNSAWCGHLEACRLLVESKADVTVMNRCLGPRCSRHVSLTISVAVREGLRSSTRSISKGKTSWNIFAASVHLNDVVAHTAALVLRITP
jgi:hypothetical protein